MKNSWLVTPMPQQSVNQRHIRENDSPEVRPHFQWNETVAMPHIPKRDGILHHIALGKGPLFLI